MFWTLLLIIFSGMLVVGEIRMLIYDYSWYFRLYILFGLIGSLIISYVKIIKRPNYIEVYPTYFKTTVGLWNKIIAKKIQNFEYHSMNLINWSQGIEYNVTIHFNDGSCIRIILNEKVKKIFFNLLKTNYKTSIKSL